MPQVKVPILYAYIFRNIKKINSYVIDVEEARIALRKIIYKAPRLIYREIFDELCEMKLLKRINREKYLILNNRNCERQLKRLNEYIFPIKPCILFW